MDEGHYENQTFVAIRQTETRLMGDTFTDCTFENCGLTACKLSGCRFIDCRFINCLVNGIELEECFVRDAELIDCSLIGVNWGQLLPPGRFSNPIGRLERCTIKYNTFPNLSLTKFSFSGSEITDSMFGECKLIESSFYKCRLDRTEFFKCDLRKADFREAVGYRIDVLTNGVKGARFSLPEAIGLLDSLGIKLQ